MTRSDRPAIAVLSALAVLVCVVLAFAVGRANGLLILALVALAVHVWATGILRRTKN